MTDRIVTAEEAQTLLDGATPGPWYYRPHKHDDWGVVRGGAFNNDWDGYPHICQARDPEKLDEATLSDHRGRGVDPWENNARLISRAPDLARAVIALTAERNALQAKLTQARDTNRRFNRRMQLLEGWWQRRVDRAKFERQVIFRMWCMDRKDALPNMKALEEAAYQRGFEDGRDNKIFIPKRPTPAKDASIGEKP